MDLILFSCRARINSFFRQKRLQRLLLLSVGLVSAGVYGWLFSFLLEQAGEGNTKLGIDQVLEYTNLFMLAIIILKGFFPAYIPKANLIPQLYPVSALERFRAELVVELVSPFYFVLLNFMLFLYMMSPLYTLLHLLQSILVILTAHITLRSLQVFIERRMRWRNTNFYSAVVMAGAFIALQVRMPMFYPASEWLMLVVHIAALGAFITSNFFLEKAAAEPRRKTVNYSSSARRSLGWRLFKNHKQARQMLLFGFAFKAFILGTDALAFAKKGEHLLDEVATLWLFVGPLVVFSYVFNNVWGFYRNLWLTVERSSGTVKDFLWVTWMALRLPLLIDAVLTFIYVAAFNHEVVFFTIMMYTSSVLILAPLSIVASIVSPKTVSGGLFSFSAKASYLFNIIAVGLMGLLFLPLIHPLLYLVYPVVIGGAIFALVAVLKEYPKYKYKLFETHFKAEA
ncbi:hypothetical protein POKO110462_02090 [Pontibacter korlensis]|uniref:Uncharacterized protein n=1 Tax=Pontibacter korlensis TaxID=400092 RepID=A0A0E3ZFT4_9BACT|nr:hypothetical protein [Pontibacter korlensis]AKD03724.1 hypothetical protein PKOR_12060 [Pontibacter korlensis]